MQFAFLYSLSFWPAEAHRLWSTSWGPTPMRNYCGPPVECSKCSLFAPVTNLPSLRLVRPFVFSLVQYIIAEGWWFRMVWTWKFRVCFQVACKHLASISQTPVSDWYRTACGLWGIFQMLPPNRYRSVCLFFPQLFYAVFCSSYMSPLFLSPHCFHGEDVFSRSRCAGNSHSCLCLWWGLRAVASSDSTQLGHQIVKEQCRWSMNGCYIWL